MYATNRNPFFDLTSLMFVKVSLTWTATRHGIDYHLGDDIWTSNQLVFPVV